MQTPAVTPPPPAPQKRVSPKTILLVVLLLATSFAAGYLPQKLDNRRLAGEVEKCEVQLRLADLHRQLGLAALEALRLNYANAAASATRFFDGCQQLAASEALASEPRTRTALGAYAASRDQIAGQLAMGDPAVAQRLVSMYFTMDGVIGRRP
jgi:hypothetical protein